VVIGAFKRGEAPLSNPSPSSNLSPSLIIGRGIKGEGYLIKS